MILYAWWFESRIALFRNPLQEPFAAGAGRGRPPPRSGEEILSLPLVARSWMAA
jgi:hypothetical protein